MSVASKADGRRASRSASQACALALIWAGVSSIIMLGVAAPSARAQEQTLWFDIPAQPLSAALLEFARQGQVQLLLPEGSLDGVSAKEVRGVMRPSVALSRLLEGTDFAGRLEDGVVRLSRAEAAQARVRARRDPGLLLPRTETVVDDDIVVVGTNIRGIYPSSSPVDIYAAGDIARTGSVRTEQFIDTLTQNLDTRVQHAPGSTAAPNYEGVNGIDLRGLGVGATLVLVNGRRLPLASEGRTADVSLIPLSAVDRIEVLTDGASAIYGSDAIGGVVNFVLRSDIESPETRVDFGRVTEGRLRSGGVAHSIGGRWENGAAFLSASAQSASALEGVDRDFASGAGRSDLSPTDMRYNLVGSFSLDATRRLALSGDLLAGLRRVKAESEFSDIDVFLVNKAEAESIFLAFDADYHVSDALQASLSVVNSTRDDFIQQQALSSSGIGSSNLESEYWSFDATAKLDGRLGRLPGGDVRFSLGGGQMDESYWSRRSGRDLGRSMSYVFAEAFAPILSEAQGIPFARRLELNAAARYTNYADESQPPLANDFGDRVSPKIGLLWAPADWLSLRGSISESFRAPSLVDLDPTRAAINSLTVSPLRGEPVIVLATLGPSSSLAPETARTYTAGFDLTLPSEPRFRVRATYFNVDYSGRVSIPDPTLGLASFSDPDAFSDILFAAQSTSLIEEILTSTTNTFNATGIDLSDPGAAAAQLIALPNFVVFDDRLRNLDRVRIDGFDLDVAYGLDTPAGEVSLGGRATYLMDYTEKRSAGIPTSTLADTVLRPVDLRGRAYVSLARDELDATIAVNYVDDYRNPYSASVGEVASWTTWNIHVAFNLKRPVGTSDGASLSLSVQNIFDRDPPFVAASDLQGIGLRMPIGFDRANANPIGRFISIELSKRW